MLTALALVATLSAPPPPAPTPIADYLRATVESLVLQTTPPPRPSWLKRYTVGMGVTSISFASIAMGLSAVCLTDGSCVEANALMRKLLNAKGTASTIIIRAAFEGALHYLVWRLPFSDKWKATMFTALAGFNGFDAIHDIRLLREIARERR